jgi:hypothetical protein
MSFNIPILNNTSKIVPFLVACDLRYGTGPLKINHLINKVGLSYQVSLNIGNHNLTVFKYKYMVF